MRSRNIYCSGSNAGWPHVYRTLSKYRYRTFQLDVKWAAPTIRRATFPTWNPALKCGYREWCNPPRFPAPCKPRKVLSFVPYPYRNSYLNGEQKAINLAFFRSILMFFLNFTCWHTHQIQRTVFPLDEILYGGAEEHALIVRVGDNYEYSPGILYISCELHAIVSGRQYIDKETYHQIN